MKLYEITKETLEWAFKKLQKYYYYSNTNFIKKKIIEFQKSFTNDSFENMAKYLNMLALKNYNIASEIVSYNIYPKKDGVAFENGHTIVNNFNAFIDMPLDFYLVDVLFTVILYSFIGNNGLDMSYGNTFDKKFLYINNTLENSLLFNNFNVSYRKWNESIYKALLENDDQDNIVIKFDIERCFYNFYFNIDDFLNELDKTNTLKENSIVKIMKHIYRYYSGILNQNDLAYKHNNCDIGYVHLPIGLLSAYPILNYYFNKIDKEIVTSGNCLSYARYVDDVLIVKKYEGVNDVNEIIEGLTPLFCKNSISGNIEISNLNFGKFVLNANKSKAILYRKGTSLNKFKKKISNILQPSLDFIYDEEANENSLEQANTYNLSYLRKKVLDMNDFESENDWLNFVDNLNYDEIVNLYSYWSELLEAYLNYTNKDEYNSFIEKIRDAIESVMLRLNGKDNLVLTNNLKNKLRKELEYCVSLVSGEYKDNLIVGISQNDMLNYLANVDLGFPKDKDNLFYPIEVTKFQISFYLTLYETQNELKDLNKKIEKLFKKANNYPIYDLIEVEEEFCIDKGYIGFKYLKNNTLEPENDLYATVDTIGNLKVRNRDESNVKIAVANMNLLDDEICETDFIGSYPSTYSFKTVSNLVKGAKRNGVEYICFSEFALPFNDAYKLISLATKYHISIICGLTHYINNKKAKNYILVIDVNISLAILKQKNYFADEEKVLCAKHNVKFEEPIRPYYLKIDNGKFIYSTMTCYEATSIEGRALLSDKIEVLFMPVYNKDTNYFSNIVGSFARDASCFVVQSNTNCYGDSRITGPYSQVKMDIVKLKGGDNCYYVIGTIKLNELEEKHKAKADLDKALEERIAGIINNCDLEKRYKKYKSYKVKPLSAGCESIRAKNIR